MLYQYFLKPLLFLLQPETAHHLVMRILALVCRFEAGQLWIKGMAGAWIPQEEVHTMGLRFKNRIGLAAGFDKDGRYLDTLRHLGFGFIEIGTVTPKPQAGNDAPRLFRLPKDEALINRMGFNNDGVDALCSRLATFEKGDLIIGGNIGKNKITPNEEAANDYLICFEKLYPYVDYFVINISSPNTPGLRALQEREPLMKLLQLLSAANANKVAPKPLLLKIAPDLHQDQILEIGQLLIEANWAGIITTNTTLDRAMLHTPKEQLEKIGTGGLSGRPLLDKANYAVKSAKKAFGNHSMCIIGVGGIHSGNDAAEKLNIGADLIQVYTGFVYEGPKLIREIKEAIK